MLKHFASKLWGWGTGLPLIWIAFDAETIKVKNINQCLLTVSSGDDEEELALWLRVVPWDGTVSLWWKSVPNPRPSRLQELYYLFNSSPLSVTSLQFVSLVLHAEWSTGPLSTSEFILLICQFDEKAIQILDPAACKSFTILSTHLTSLLGRNSVTSLQFVLQSNKYFKKLMVISSPVNSS